MRKCLLPLLAAAIYLFPASHLQADDAADAKAIIAKAVQAHGGEQKLLKQKVMRQKFKANMEIMGMSIDMTGSNLVQVPGQYRTDIQMEFMGQNIGVTQIYNKGKAWLKVLDKTMELEKEQLDAQKSAVYEMEVRVLVPLLKDDKYTLAMVGEEKVNGKPAVGIKITAKDQKDVDLYFDKASGLLVKRVGRGLDPVNKQEVNQEQTFSDFKEIDGLKIAAKVIFTQDGKKFMDMEITETQFLDKVDDSEFAQP